MRTLSIPQIIIRVVIAAIFIVGCILCKADTIPAYPWKALGFGLTYIPGQVLTKGQIQIAQGPVCPSAALVVNDTARGALLPRMTSAQMAAIVDPCEGLLIYNTSTGAFNYYNGSAWVEVGGGGGFWSQDGDNLYPSTLSNNVGIGTATPSGFLDVVSGGTYFRFDGSLKYYSNDPYFILDGDGRRFQMGDYTYDWYGTYIDINDDIAQRYINLHAANGVTVSNLAGSGTGLVGVDNDGLLSFTTGPNLQNVTDNGQHTTNQIYLDGTYSTSIWPDQAFLKGTDAASNSWEFNMGVNLTQSNQYVLPDTSGVLAMSVNGVLADAKGNVQINIDSLLPYLEYVCLFDQSDSLGDPDVTVIRNTLGGDVVWTRLGPGEFMATLANAFNPTKILLPPTMHGNLWYYGGQMHDLMLSFSQEGDDDYFLVACSNRNIITNAYQSQDYVSAHFGAQTPLTIRVYK